MNKDSKPSGFVIFLMIVIWISSFMIETTLWALEENNTAIVISLLFLSINEAIQGDRMLQFLLHIHRWIVLLSVPVGLWAEDRKKNSKLPQTFLDNIITGIHGVP